LLRTLPAARALPRQGDRWRRAASHGHAFARVCRCPPGTAHVSASALPHARLVRSGCSRTAWASVVSKAGFVSAGHGMAKGIVRRGGSRRNGAQIDLRVDWFTGIRNRVGLSREVQHLLPPTFISSVARSNYSGRPALLQGARRSDPLVPH
jgi:hypothetical protein